MGVISVIIGVAGGMVWLVSPERGKFSAAQAVAMAEDASGPLLDDGLAADQRDAEQSVSHCWRSRQRAVS